MWALGQDLGQRVEQHAQRLARGRAAQAEAQAAERVARIATHRRQHVRRRGPAGGRGDRDADAQFAQCRLRLERVGAGKTDVERVGQERAGAVALRRREALANRDALVAAGLERARAFSWQATADRTVAVYREALGR